MTTLRIRDLLESEGRAAEEAEFLADPDAPLPAHVKVIRGHSEHDSPRPRSEADEHQAP